MQTQHSRRKQDDGLRRSPRSNKTRKRSLAGWCLVLLTAAAVVVATSQFILQLGASVAMTMESAAAAALRSASAAVPRKEGGNNKTSGAAAAAATVAAKPKRIIHPTESEWQPVFPNAAEPPYSAFAPHIDVIWARGWYNAHLPPSSLPIGYFNKKGIKTNKRTPPSLLTQYWNASALCPKGGNHTFLWIRQGDDRSIPNYLSKFPKHCNISIITGDNAKDGPGLIHTTVRMLLNTSQVHRWYAQNTASVVHPHVHPIPLGLPLHYGFKDSPHTLDTVQTMFQFRQDRPAFDKRSRTILVDVGTLKGGERQKARLYLKLKIEGCGLQAMPKVDTLNAWRNYSSYQFAVAPRGVGRDTYRLWEYLFFGTIPIIKSGDVDLLVLPAHVPVLIVDDWDEVCHLAHNETLYNQTVDRYRDWIQSSHYWVRPSLWVPRDQATMDALCDQFPGCLEAAKLSHRLTPRNISVAMEAAKRSFQSAAASLNAAAKRLGLNLKRPERKSLVPPRKPGLPGLDISKNPPPSVPKKSAPLPLALEAPRVNLG